MKMVKISENTDSDQKTSSAGKIFTPPLKTKKAQKPRGYRVFEPFDDKKELHLERDFGTHMIPQLRSITCSKASLGILIYWL